MACPIFIKAILQANNHVCSICLATLARILHACTDKHAATAPNSCCKSFPRFIGLTDDWPRTKEGKKINIYMHHYSKYHLLEHRQEWKVRQAQSARSPHVQSFPENEQKIKNSRRKRKLVYEADILASLQSWHEIGRIIIMGSRMKEEGEKRRRNGLLKKRNR